jgi:hypothetical protein
MTERAAGAPIEGKAMMREARKGESNRQARLEHRRLMATSGAMPGSLAGKFTLGQDATLCVIANEYLGGDNYLGRSATIILAGRVGRERQL